MQENTTRIFYKYRNFDGRSLSMLANNQLYFASPLDFNDPFDCSAMEHMFDDFSEKHLERLALSHPDVSPEAVTRDKTLLLIEELKKHPEINRIKEEQERALKKFLQNLGVLSVTTCNNSILMWSHYADFHKGFCIGFKKNIGLDKNCIAQVNYSKNRGNDMIEQYLSMENMSKEQKYQKFINEFIYTKYIDWEYEAEWRITGDVGIAIYPEDCVDSIIFGAKMLPENKNTILYLMRNRGIKFFEAIKNQKDFSLKIQRII